MRTNVVIDDTLMQRALQTSGAKTKRDAVERGLQLLVQLGTQGQAREIKGKIAWDGDLEAMRLAK